MLCQLVLVSCLALLSVADAQAITVLAPQPSASYALNVPVTISWSAVRACALTLTVLVRVLLLLIVVVCCLLLLQNIAAPLVAC